MVTPVSKLDSASLFTNPVMLYVRVGSISPNTFESPEVAVTVKGASCIVRVISCVAEEKLSSAS